jgi:hypothetical protein
MYFIRTNTHLNCAVVYCTNIYFKMCVWNSYLEQLEMDSKYIIDYGIQKRMCYCCLSVIHTQSSNFLLTSNK